MNQETLPSQPTAHSSILPTVSPTPTFPSTVFPTSFILPDVTPTKFPSWSQVVLPSLPSTVPRTVRPFVPPTFPSTVLPTTRPTIGSTDTGTLAGGIVGGLLVGVVITVVVVVVWWSCRRRRQRSQQAYSSDSYSGRSKNEPVVVPDVIKMSSSGPAEDYHEYHVISESQNRKPETGDYVDIRDEDLQDENLGYELAGDKREMPSSKIDSSAIGKTGYELAGGFQEKSTGHQNPNNNKHAYDSLEESNMKHPRIGIDNEKTREPEDPGQVLTDDYYLLNEQADQGQYNRLGAPVATGVARNTYDRLGQIDKADKSGDDDVSDEGDTYHRLGQKNQKQASGAGHAYEEVAVDVYNRLGQDNQVESNKSGNV